jgi:hypothetical protein
MEQGQILKQARSDSRTFVFVFAVLVAVSGGVMGYYAKYIYNVVAGPAPFTKALAAAPGMREFVRAEGEIVSTGSKEATIHRQRSWPRRGILGALARASSKRTVTETETITANFLAMFVDGGVLIVKAPPDFSGHVVQGKLVPLPLDLRQRLERANADNDAADASGATEPSAGAAGAAEGATTATAETSAAPLIHPQMIDATSSYRSFSLFNMFLTAAAVILPLSLLGLRWAVRSMLDAARHPGLRRVVKHGPYLALVPRIEREIAAAGEQARVGLYWISPNWIVTFSPNLDIYPVRDIIGIAHESKTKTSGNQTTVTHWITMWMRDEPFDKSLDNLSEDEAQRVVSLLEAQHPGIVVEDENVAVIRKRWSADHTVCTREMETARRRAVAEAKEAARAAQAAPPASADAAPTPVVA